MLNTLILVGIVAVGFAAQFFLMFRRPRFEWRALIPLFTYLVLLAWGLLRAYEIIVLPYDRGAFLGSSGQWMGILTCYCLIFLALGSATAAVGILAVRLIKKLRSKKQ